MVMDTLQIRLNPEMVNRLDDLIKQGKYSSRSDAIRDAVRRFVWDMELGSIKGLKGNSVELVREARVKLSNEKIDLDEINNFK